MTFGLAGVSVICRFLPTWSTPLPQGQVFRSESDVKSPKAEAQAETQAKVLEVRIQA